ncbi:MAG: dihydrolipoyl dehydrogenase [Solibacillus sp.]
MSQVDLVVIGAGPGGYVAAIKAAQLGKKVVLIEKQHVGGTCLNTGCIPSKSYLKHADWLMTMKQAQQFGIEHQVKAIHFDKLVARKNNVVRSLQNGIQHLLQKNGIVYVEGEATLDSKKKVKVGEQVFEAKHVLLATGSTPFVPPIKGLEAVVYHTTDTFFEMKTLPKKLVIVGGGVIAVELAFAMAALNVEVTIIEVAKDILLTEDVDVRQLLKGKLQSLNITVKTGVEIFEVMANTVKTAVGDISYDELLIATGRKANLAIPQQLGLELENNRFIKIDTHYETSLAGIYAIGDAIGGLMLAHVASAEGIHVATHLYSDVAAPVHASMIPKCIYTNPEVASFGLTEEQAKQLGYDVKVKKMPYSHLGKAIATIETEGFVKIITESKYNEILGAVIVGAHATETIHTILAVKQAEGCLDELATMTFGHPTLSELIGEVSNSLISKAIHE